MKIHEMFKRPLKDYILYSLMGYAFASAISITFGEFFFLLGLILWIADVIKNKIPLKEQFRSSVSIPLLFFLFFHLLSAIFGIDALNSLKDFRKTYLILLFFLAANYSGNGQDIKKILKSFLSGAVIVGFYAIINTAYHRYGLGDMNFRASSFSGNHMHAGGMLMLACLAAASSLAFKLKNDIKDKKGIVLYAAAFLIISGGLLFTYTRGSWLAAFIGVLMIAGYTDRKLLAAVVAVFVLAAFVMKGTSFMDRVESGIKVKPKSSANERMLMWQSGIQMIKERPLIGIGTANLDKVYPKYRQPEAVEMNQGHLHNNMIQLAVIDGIPGTLVYIWIFIAMWAGYIKGIFAAKDAYLKSVLYLGLCASAAFFVNGFFEYNLFSSQPALMFWFLTGLGSSAMKPAVVNPERKALKNK